MQNQEYSGAQKFVRHDSQHPAVLRLSLKGIATYVLQSQLPFP